MSDNEMPETNEELADALASTAKDIAKAANGNLTSFIIVAVVDGELQSYSMCSALGSNLELLGAVAAAQAELTSVALGDFDEADDEDEDNEDDDEDEDDELEDEDGE